MKALKFSEVKRDLKEWIENIPVANPLRVSELIYNKLAELPITEFTAPEGITLLEMLRAPIHFLNEQLQQHLANRGTQSIVEPDKQITQAISLLMRYASAYAVLLNLADPNEQLPDGKPILAICIHRALSNLSRVLLVSYQLYRMPPAQLWLRLHKLYLQAEKARLTSLNVPHSSDEAQTIEEAYKVCCLLASANPYQLRAIDMLKLYEGLLQWSHYAKIISTNLQDILIISKLDEDTPPFYQKINTDQHSPFLRGLDTSQLINHILSSIKQHGHSLNDQKSALSPSTLQNIANAWSRFSGRIATRNAHEGNIQVSIGLTATHVHMSAEKGLIYLEADNGENNSEGFIHYPIFVWQIINMSDTGYCLQSTIQQMIALEVGELVGLNLATDETVSWQIGMIRWVKKVDEFHFQLGIMHLAPNSIPTTVQISRKHAKQQYRGFILSPDLNVEMTEPSIFPSPASSNSSYSLVIPALDLIADEHLTLLFDNHPHRIRLTEPLCLNNKFYQFKYEVVEEQN